ncbi:MAG: hypothetical protein ACXVRI_11520, partial [Gaiellaceae bacterium]
VGPGAIATLDRDHVLRVAQDESLVCTRAEYRNRAAHRFGSTGTNRADESFGFLALVLEIHDVLLREGPVSARSGRERSPVVPRPWL